MIRLGEIGRIRSQAKNLALGLCLATIVPWRLLCFELIDNSHLGEKGVPFGKSGKELARYQTFIADKNRSLETVQIKIRKVGNGDHSDLSMKLYETAYEKPARTQGKPLASTIVFANSIGSDWTQIRVPLRFTGLQAGKRYALVVTQNYPSNSNHFEWCWNIDASKRLASGRLDQSHGESEPQWIAESHQGNCWMKLRVHPGTLALGRPTKIRANYPLVRRSARIAESKSIEGDFILQGTVAVQGPDPTARVFFAASNDRKDACFFSIKKGHLSLIRAKGGNETIIRQESFRPPLGPWKLRLQKRGIYYLLNINDQDDWVTWVAHPSGEVFYSVPGRFSWRSYSALEPSSGYVGLEGTGDIAFSDVQISPIGLGTGSPDIPVVSYSDIQGTWNESQCFPGAVLEDGNGKAYRDKQGYAYLYVNGSDAGSDEQESGGVIRIGVVRSRDLVNWDWCNRGNFVLEATKGAWDGVSVFANGAMAVVDGGTPKFMIQYAGYGGNGTAGGWNGQGYAFSRHPEGPFVKDAKNPVIGSDVGMHEGHFTKVSNLFYYFRTLFHKGDRAYYSTGTDLYEWTHNPRPILSPKPGAWDGEHVRARSVNKVGNTWYLLYEGASRDVGREAIMPERWWDSVGLAKSKDLTTWIRSSLNPFIPQQPGDRFDSTWTGWPRMVLEGENAFIYYAAGGYDFMKPRHQAGVGLLVLPVAQLTGF